MGISRASRWLVVVVGVAAVAVVAVLAARHVRAGTAYSVEGCRSYVAKHSAAVLREARRVAGPGADLDYRADCSSYDSGGAEGAVVDAPSVIESRMRSRGSVVLKEDRDCVRYQLPQDPTAICTYFEYRPRGATLTFEVSMPDPVEQTFAMRIKPTSSD